MKDEGKGRAVRLRMHHVGVVVKEIPRASSHYIENLGYEVKSEIIHDPVQTAFVQFFQLPGDSVYLELVAPDREESMLSNALKKRMILNHVAYAVEDVGVACRALRSRGMVVVREPVAAVAFRQVAWLIGRDQALIELVEQGSLRIL
jgi:methylmalonyl-CoA/ethylmalonyl-CoA epimerase